MINDFDIDMEELESRLYCQVYHSSTNDDEPQINVQNSSEKVNLYYQNSRYFHTKIPTTFPGGELDYIPLSDTNTANSKYAVPWRAKIQASDFFNIDSNVMKDIPIEPNNEIRQNVNMINPQNNILVLPQASSHIIPTGEYIQSNQIKTNFQRYLDRQAQRQQKKQKKVERYRQKQNDRKRLLKKQRQAEELNLSSGQISSGFTVHYLNETNIFSKPDQENRIVTVSDSDDSCCVEIPQDRELVVLSSDESDIQQEKNYMTRIKESTETCKQSHLLETDLVDKGNVCTDSVFSDDDVLFIDDIPKDLEIIDIDCDMKSIINEGCNKISSIKSIESDSTNSDPRKLHSIAKFRSSIKHKAIITKERNELLKTPDSTSNDFLDGNLDLQQKKFNFGLHGSDFGNNHTFIKPKPHADIYETESSCSASDNSTPVKNSMFHEVEFETPNKELFNESNLETFGNYITPNRDNRPETVSLNNQFKQINTKANKENRIKAININSDSSSESDYDGDKLHLNKVKRKLPDLTSVGSQYAVGNSLNKKENVSTEIIPKKKTKSDNSEVKVNKNFAFAEVSKQSTVDSNTLDIIYDSPEVHCISDEENNISKTMNTINDIYLANCKPLAPILHSDHKFKRFTGFSKYWTTDMNKFYNTSWGLENFSVEEVQKTMLDDQNSWQIIDEDRKRVNLNIPRGRRCHKCREIGHMALRCPNNKRSAICSLCGEIGHYDVRCPNALCTLCGSPGGYGTYCSSCANWRYNQCNICSMYGHIDIKCPDQWRRYHLTTHAGPIVKTLKPNYRRIEDRWCSGCAKSGHYEYKCRSYTRSHHSVDPYIKEYNDIYNFPKSHEFLIYCNNTADRNTERDKEKSDNKHNTTENVNTGSSSGARERNTNITNIRENIQNMEKLNNKGTNTDVYFKNFVFPPMEMIPPYFREHVTTIENQFYNKYTDNMNVTRNSINVESSCVLKVPKYLHNTFPNRDVHRSTYTLNYKLFAFLYSSKGIDFLKYIEEQPNISILISKNGDEETSGGMIEIYGGLKKVKSIESEFKSFCKSIPKLENMPKFSKTVYSFLLPKLDKVERIVGNCKSLYNNLSKLKLQLASMKDTSQIKKKIKEIKLQLNMLLFGKLRLGDGQKHMDNLQYWQKQFEKKDNYKIPLNILYDLYDSYSFIFLDTVNHNYKVFCSTQANSSRYMRNPIKDKKLITRYYKLVEQKCRKFNMLDKLQQLNHFKSAIYQPNFSVKAFKEFMTYCYKFLHFIKTHVL